jgi:hypothetical protein
MTSTGSEAVASRPITSEAIEAELDRRGHIVTSWSDLGSITL